MQNFSFFLSLRSEQRTVTGSERLATVMDRPIFIEQGDNFDSFTRGMNTDGSESRDFNIDPEISTFFKARDRANGGDLKAIDIQRDRDQGIGSYNDFRVLAGLRRANSFSDLSDSVSSTVSFSQFKRKLFLIHHFLYRTLPIFKAFTRMSTTLTYQSVEIWKIPKTTL